MSATVVVAALWAALWSLAYGSVTALAAIGKEGGVQNAAFAHDLPHGYRFVGLGHDGRFFYTIARTPFDYHLLRQRLDLPAYRYRRILFPLVAGRLAPHGGVLLILAFLLLSLIGVAIGARALTRFPGAPPWLPLTMAIDPGVIVALWASLSDALATGLVIAAFAVVFRRRWGVATVLLVLACLTRETSVLAALCLACWPGLPRRARLTLALVPGAVLGAWTLVVWRVMRGPLTQAPKGGLFTWPFGGWAQGTASSADLLISAAVGVLLVAAVASRRPTPLPVRLYLGANVVLMMCSTVAITYQWIDATRAPAPAVPLAVWVLCRRQRATAPVSRPLAAPA